MNLDEVVLEIERLDDLWKNAEYIEAKELGFTLLEQNVLQNETKLLAKIYNILGIVFRNLSNYTMSIEYYTKALHINEESNTKLNISVNLMNIGNVYNSMADYKKALEYYSKSVVINEEIGNKEGIARNLGSIATIYRELLDFHKALEYNANALYIFEEIGNKVDIALCLGNTGNVFFSLSDVPKALEYFSKALQIYYEIENKVGIARNLGNIGNVYVHHLDFSKALEYYEKALQYNEEIGNKESIAINLGNIAKIYSSKESKFFDRTKAEQYLQKSLSIAEEIGSKTTMQSTYNQLYTLRVNEQKFEEALFFKLQVIELDNEIRTNESKTKADQFDYERKTAEREKQLAIERTRYEERENILRNILPDSVTDRLVKGENPIADHFQSVSVLFMDLVGFTSLATIAPPKQLVYLLDTIFTKADEIVESFGLEKIKTIGDGYMAVANVTTAIKEHQKATALATLQLIESMHDFTVNIPVELGDTKWIKNMNDIEIRIGIHTGEVVAGIIGKNKYTYDLWGDAVNVASRMESNSEAGRIHISSEFASSIEQYPEFKIIPRGEITIKGKGTMNTFWLEKGK